MHDDFSDWADLTAPAIAALAARDALVIWPLAATEQHGPHLPTGTDAIINRAMLLAALPLLPPALRQRLVVLPPQVIGFSPEHLPLAGSLSLEAELLLRIGHQLGAQLAKQGFRRLLLFNSHGGNAALMEILAQELRQRQPMAVGFTAWGRLAGAMPMIAEAEKRYGIHAGQVETAVMLAVAPELVRLEHAADFTSAALLREAHWQLLDHGRRSAIAWQMQDLHPSGAVGNAAAADAAQGRAIIAAVAPNLAALLADMLADNLPGLAP